MKKLVFGIALLAFAAQAGAQGSVLTSVADATVTGAATKVASGNSLRAILNCTVHGSVNARWGDSAITATRGQRIPAGATFTTVARGEVYMISEGANVTVSCTEELR